MDFKIKWEEFIKVLIDKGGYKRVITGLENTLVIAVSGLFIGLLIGIIIAAIECAPQNNVVIKILDKICKIYVGFFRGSPVVVQLLITKYVLLPMFGIIVDSVVICCIVFGLNSAAYESEIIRSGLNSVDIGQTEAGRALGLNYPTTMIKIIIPQAIKNILPTIGNEFISLIKETSVVSFVGAMDLYTAFQKIGSNSYDFIIPYLSMAVIYIILVMIITLLVKLLERRFKASDRS